MNMARPPAGTASAAAARCAVVSCRLGPVRFAVPMDRLQQVLPHPPALAALPRRGGALQGAMTHRGQALPLVDLRRWLPWPGDASSAPAQVLLLREGPRRLAVAIDAVEGLHHIDAAQLQRLHHGGDAEELFDTVVNLPGGGPGDPGEPALGLLDVPALMRLSQSWLDADPAGAADSPAENGGAGGPAPALDGTQGDALTEGASARPRRPYALLECEGEWLALPATEVQAVLAMPSLQRPWRSDTRQLGLARWRGRDLPVLRLLPGLGLGRDSPAPAPLLAVVSQDGHYVGLAVDAVQELQALDPRQATDAAAALGVPPHPVLAGLLHRADGRRLLLIDVAALLAGCPLAALSTRADRDQAGPRGTGQAATGAGPGAPAQVVVQAGRPWALPIHQVLGITELAAQQALDAPPSPDSAPGLVGHQTWRGQTVALWDLRLLTGHGATAPGPERRVLLLQAPDGAVVGLVVEALLQLLPARTAELRRLTRPDGRKLDVITHQQGGVARSCEALDPQLWHRLHDPAAAPDSAGPSQAAA